MRKTKYAVAPTEAERAQLRTMVGRGVAPARALTRARVLLKADQGEGGAAWADAAIAEALDLHPAIIARVRRQFVAEGLDAALARKRPDRVDARALDGRQEAHLVALTLRDAPGPAGPLEPAAARRRTGPPGGRGRDLPRDRAPHAQKNDLKPWLSEQWCLAPTADPAFVWQMGDVLDVYARPLDPARPVVCLSLIHI